VRLERECEAARAQDPYVFEELEHLYRASGDLVRADAYAARRKAAAQLSWVGSVCPHTGKRRGLQLCPRRPAEAVECAGR
jgi:hypothetical protein